MASNYGYNFGFRRSDEHVRMSEGGYKTPTTGTLLQGTAVEIDFASAGYLKACAASATLRPGVSGLLIQEEGQFPSIYDPQYMASELLGTTKKNAPSVITSGSGVKIWLKNTSAVTQPDGHVRAAVTIVNLTGVTVGGFLGWNGTAWANTATASEAWFRVLSLTSTGVEAVMQA